MRKLLVIMGAFVALQSNAQELSFKNKKASVQNLTLEQIRQQLPVKDIKVYEPHEKREVTYTGVAMRDLLQKVYKSDWQKAEEVLFTCVDGYQPSIPMTQFQKYDAYLVFRRADDPKFNVTNKLQNNETVPLGPFYLIWNNLKDKQLQEEGANGWPYQIVGMDLISFRERFPGLSLPDKASGEARYGFLEYRKHCMNCHRINGEGAEKSVELNYPVNVTEYFRKEYLVRWIDNPQNVRYGSPMPAFNRSPTDRSKSIRAIIAYLEAMKAKKIAPKDTSVSK